ncbi:MAG: hypothetical protein DSM106950_32540 [Stigonema ocellatum SAG 48.90 = DSM 106950]|nr:hypothetical protein [Stigonema ocellatum SAG 48.90 = DSM 106950]
MEDKSAQEHFLDTSVARSKLLATQTYKQYFELQFADQPLYISNYVQMEIRRSYLINLISFYFVLRLETINSISDAIALWSNRFKTSSLKAILQLEHTDNSFDYLCPPINQPYYKHPSENQIVMNVSIEDSESVVEDSQLLLTRGDALAFA